MPRLTKRQKDARQKSRKKGKFCTSESEKKMEEALEFEWTDVELENFEQVGKKLLNEVLQWDKNTKVSLRSNYNGTSRTTTWRKQKEEEEMKEHAKQYQKLDSYLMSSKKLVLNNEDLALSTKKKVENEAQLDTALIKQRINELNIICNVTKSAISNAKVFTYDYVRLLSTRKYLQHLLDGKKKMNSSLQIAQEMWNKGAYMSRCIRNWGDHYLKTGELPIHQQGKHVKIVSCLDDEDFTKTCKKWLRQQKPEERNPCQLKTYIEEVVFPTKIGSIKKDTIGEETCRRYMHLWGFEYDELKKGVFYDGHERPDVVKYRQEWLKKMFTYKKYMKDFSGDNLDQIVEPILNSNEKEHVMVTHDECHFYSNDGRKTVWVLDEENVLRPKHIGRSIMVSDFLCPCHGPLRLTEEEMQQHPQIQHQEARVLRSVQVDGYWKSEHMVDQLYNRAIPIFEVLHPGCIGVFCFDQSTNHNAMAEDALAVSKMNLSPGGQQPQMRNGWFITTTGQMITQQMVFDENYPDATLRGKPKGIKQILLERGLWREGLKLSCEKCMKREEVPERSDCCARRIMMLQPDFASQKSILEETVEKMGHIIEKYPKFHCECNFIERYWGYSKRETRRRCRYTYADLLRTVPEVLNSVPITVIRKFSRKSWRYMDAYQRGLEGRVAEWAVKKFKSHRRLPDNIEEYIEQEC